MAYSFRQECRNFLRFIAHPRLTPRPVGRRVDLGGWADWFPGVSVGRLLQWALVLWLINLFFLGPIALVAAGLGGAEHKLSLDHLPWLQAVLWAPVIEELVFRYGLRRPWQALWLVPVCVAALLWGPRWSSVALLGLVLLACWWALLRPGRPSKVTSWRFYRRYVRCFPLVVHLSCLLFAAVHLNNFFLNQTALWLMPLLVLPQWLTGLVLAWLRVRWGIGASILLHGLFNGGPLLLVWLLLQYLPGLAQ